jgi:hypothetical protein
MWELNKTSSWLNFHLQRDHQNNGNEIAGFCGGGVRKIRWMRDEGLGMTEVGGRREIA